MKRLIVAVSFAALAVPTFAAERVAAAKAPNAAPYEQQVIDRTLPNIDTPRSASAGETGAPHAVSPWANDFRFIAPPR
jgi:hypothetical protein